MSHEIKVEGTQEQKKAQLRSWLFRLLSEIEASEIDYGEVTEGSECTLISVYFKRG